MKAILTTFVFALLASMAFTQAPQSMNYQAIAREMNGNPILTGSLSSVQFEILEGSSTGSQIFTETHDNVSLSPTGLFNLKIGSKNPAQFSTIPWSTGTKYLKVTINGNITATATQMLSVPYALYAASGATPDIAIFEEQKNPGNDFTGTVGTYTKRLLNVEVLSSPSVQLTANNEMKFVMPGVYIITGSAYAYDKGSHKIVLRNNGTIVLEGTTEVNLSAVQDASNRSFIMGKLSVPQGTSAANPYFCTLDHYSATFNSGTFGNGINAPGSTHETYSQLMIQKIQ